MATSASRADRLWALAERAFLQTFPEGVAVVDASGRIAGVNAALARMLGASKAQLLGRPAVELVAPDARAEASAALGEKGAVLPLVADGGRTVWVQLASAPLVDDGGARAGTLWLATDITESRRSQQALQRVADVSRALVEDLDFEGIARVVARSVDGGVGVYLYEGEKVAVCRALATVDAEWEEYASARVGEAVPILPGTISEEVVRTGKPQLLGADVSRRLHPVLAPLGAEVRSAVVAPLIVHGRAIGVMGFFRLKHGPPFEPGDIPLLHEIADRTALALARAVLAEEKRRTNERLRLLADAGRLLGQSLEVLPTMSSVAHLAVQWFADGCVLQLWNEQGLVVEARDPSLREKLFLAFLPYLGPKGAHYEMRTALESGHTILHSEMEEAALRRVAVDDEHLRLLRALEVRSLIVVPLLARGVPVGVFSFVRTSGRPYDEDERACAEELARRAALAIDNARLFRSANEAIAIRDDFIGIASHELNTPLTSLRMYIDTLRRGRIAPERVGEKLDAAARQVTRLAQLVSQLLDVSRFGAGRFPLEPESFDMAALVDDVVAAMADEAHGAGVPFVVRAERPCAGMWDRARLEQVMTNLLRNAVRYGSGKPVEITLSKTAAGIRLSVRDHGIGIAPEAQQRIFERFGRASSSRNYGGFGLGLWIVQQIVQASGGTVTVDSAPGCGATFVVELPLLPPAP
jgi:PAS domain S-box-containing protein